MKALLLLAIFIVVVTAIAQETKTNTFILKQNARETLFVKTNAMRFGDAWIIPVTEKEFALLVSTFTNSPPTNIVKFLK